MAPAKQPPLACGIPDIKYERECVNKMEQNTGLLAGCLGLQNALHVWDLLLKDVYARPILTAWAQHAKNQFGTQLSSNKLVIRPQVVSMAFEDEFQSVIFGDDRPVVDGLKVTNTTIAPLTCLWAQHPASTAMMYSTDGNCWHGPVDSTELRHKNHTQRPPSPHGTTSPTVAGSASDQAAAGTPASTGSTAGSSTESWGMTAKELCEIWDAIGAAAIAQAAEGDQTETNRQQRIDAVNDHVRMILDNVFFALDKKRATGIPRPPINPEDREHLLQLLIELDDFTNKCVIWEPENTEVPDKPLEARSLAQLASHGESLQDLSGANDTADPGTDDQAAQAEFDKTAVDIAPEAAKKKVPKGISAPVRTWEEACTALGLDPTNPILRPEGTKIETLLKMWQVLGADWMLTQESTPVGGGIVADGCGTGKTTTCLTTVYSSGDRPADLVTGYQPTVIICPATLLEMWLTEIETRFGLGLRVKVFHGQAQHIANLRRKNMTLTNMEELRAFVSGLDPKDRSTARTVVLTTYATWAFRTVQEDQSKEPVSGKTAQENIDAIDLFKAIQAKAAAVEQKKPPKSTRYKTLAAGLFGRVILDEGHAVKTIAKRWHQSVRLLECPHVWVSSATPLQNRVADICGYLSLFFTPTFADMTPNDLPVTIDADDPVSEFKAYSEMEELPKERPYHLLAPRKFAALVSNGYVSARSSSYSIPVIMKMISIRRNMGDLMDPRDPARGRIGDDMPPMRVMTVELRHPERIQKIHDERFQDIALAMKSSGEASHLDWGGIRLLSYVGFTPVLDDFARTAKTVNTTADKVHKYASRPDKGFAFLWARVNSDRKACIPPAQVSTAYWLAADCIKLRYVLKIFFDEGLFNPDPNAPRPRFLLFVHWPLILWYVELFLSNIGVEFVVIRSSMTDMERTAAASRFVDPKSQVKILLTTFACGAHGLNLHTTCSRVIIIEPALNLSTIFQGAHRVHRMGQKEPQKIWILFGEHTVSQWIEANSARKAMPQVASDISHYLQPLIESDRKRREEAGQGDSIPAEDELINIETEKHLRAILGQRRSRLHMGELTDWGYDDHVVETRNKRKATSDDSDRDSKKPKTTSSLAVIDTSSDGDYDEDGGGAQGAAVENDDKGDEKDGEGAARKKPNDKGKDNGNGGDNTPETENPRHWVDCLVSYAGLLFRRLPPG